MSSQRWPSGTSKGRSRKEVVEEADQEAVFEEAYSRGQKYADEEDSIVSRHYQSSYRSGESRGLSRSRSKSIESVPQKRSSSSVLLVVIIAASLVGTYFLAHQVRAKELALALAKDMNTALATELEESRSGAASLSKQLKQLEDDLLEAQDKCTRDVKKLDVTLAAIRFNTTQTLNLLKNEKQITANLIKENEAYQKKLQAANAMVKDTASTLLRG